MEFMEKKVIKASKRSLIGKQVSTLRRQGQLPGVIYGRHIDPTPIIMDLREASRILAGMSHSSLVNLDVDGEVHSALVREKQKNFIKNVLLHVDFQAVSLTEKLRTSVTVVLEGVSPAVKDLNGFIVNGLTEIEVECFPQYLPERIMVDIAKLAKIGDGIYVRDLTLPEEITVLTAKEGMIAVVTLAGEEDTVVPGEGGAAEPEVIEKGKKEAED